MPGDRPSASPPSSTSWPRSAASASTPRRARRAATWSRRTTARWRASSGSSSRTSSSGGRCAASSPPAASSWASTWVPSTWSSRSSRRGRSAAACSGSVVPATRSVSRASGSIYPKHRGDLLEAAIVTKRMLDGSIESTRYLRNPLDVLAQQLVAHVAARGETPVADLAALVRRTATFADLSDEQLANTLDLLAGRYPSEEFSELRPRVVWNRVTDTVRARRAPSAWRSPPAGRSPTAGCSASSCPTARGSASSTRRWSTRAAPVRRSCSARRRGGSRTSRSNGSR